MRSEEWEEFFYRLLKAVRETYDEELAFWLVDQLHTYKTDEGWYDAEGDEIEDDIERMLQVL